MNIQKNFNILIYLSFIGLVSSCVKKAEEASVKSGASKLYVATGGCNSGTGITTYTTTATRTLEQYSTDDGSHTSTLLDYNASGTFVASPTPAVLWTTEMLCTYSMKTQRPRPSAR